MFINISLVFFLGCPLGLVWYHLGAFLGALGNLLEPVGTLGGLLWSYLAPFGPLWGPLDEILELLGVHLGSGWGVFGVILDVKLREWPRSAKRLCPGVFFELFGKYF